LAFGSKLAKGNARKEPSGLTHPTNFLFLTSKAVHKANAGGTGRDSRGSVVARRACRGGMDSTAQGLKWRGRARKLTPAAM